MWRIFCLLLMLIGVLSAAAPGYAAAKPEVKIGVLANMGAEKALKRWQPLADYLDQTIPEYHFIISPTAFNDLYPAIEQGKVDFVIVNTAQYVEVEVLYGVTRIATLRNLGPDGNYTHFGGVFFTRATEQEINSLANLRGRRVLAVDETSLGGWLCQLRELKAAGIEPKDFAALNYAGTHEGVVRSVLTAQADVGIIRTDTLERLAQAGEVDLRQIKIINQRTDGSFPFLHSTRLYPEWPLARLHHTDEELGRQVAIALLQLPANSAAATAADSAGWTIPADYSPVHDLFRELKMGPYRDLGKFTLWDVLSKYWPVLVSALLLLVVLAAATTLVVRANRRQQQALVALDREKQTVELTLEELHAAHDELSTTYAKLDKTNSLLSDSINYARKIQESLLPNPASLADQVADIAVCWQPLQVVSGDYFWLQQIEGRCVVVVADCTGHGVPGAFLTMVFATALEQILRERRPLTPAAMLTDIDQMVRARLRQDYPDAPSDDGLEAAVCIFDRSTATLEYAGAGIPLLIVPAEGDASELKADRAALGYGSIRPKTAFCEHTVEITPGTAYYLFTDGAPDHMGGSPLRLLGRKRLAAVIAAHRQVSLSEQLMAVCSYLENYRGAQVRRDDMTIVAFRPL